jgi:uncharacterized membrane protein
VRRRTTGIGSRITDDLLVALTVVTALGCGLVAGVLFAFSSFVMKALARLPAPQGIAAMNSINVFAVTPAFMTALFGTAAACVAVILWALVDWHDSFGPYLLAGSGLYLVGTIGVTMAYNVPRNNALAAVDPDSADGASYWARYSREWTAANHLRVIAGLGAAALLTIALYVQ